MYEDENNGLFAVLVLPFAIYAFARIGGADDLTGDFMFTVSDIWQGLWIAFTDPGIFLAQRLQHTSLGAFLEMEQWTRGGTAAVISGFLWLFLGVMAIGLTDTVASFFRSVGAFITGALDTVDQIRGKPPRERQD